jgi:sugar phosphate isomerase/epimerase
MGCFYVNLPIRYLAENTFYLDFFLRHNISPELGLDAIALDELDTAWHQKLAQKLQDAGQSCSIHLPFHDLQPGSLDDLILEATRERLQRAMHIAKIYKPRYLVGHAYFIPLYADMFSKWLSRAITTWEMAMEIWPEHAPLYLENVREIDPRPLADLMGELNSKKVKFCLDIGHWASYGNGSQYQNLSQWIQTLGPYLSHLHLHDNDGIADLHLGLGQGCISWLELFGGLEFLELSPSFTLEPHCQEDLEHSLSFMKKHMNWFARLGVRRRDLPDI